MPHKARLNILGADKASSEVRGKDRLRISRFERDGREMFFVSSLCFKTKRTICRHFSLKKINRWYTPIFPPVNSCLNPWCLTDAFDIRNPADPISKLATF